VRVGVSSAHSFKGTAKGNGVGEFHRARQDVHITHNARYQSGLLRFHNYPGQCSKTHGSQDVLLVKGSDDASNRRRFALPAVRVDDVHALCSVLHHYTTWP